MNIIREKHSKNEELEKDIESTKSMNSKILYYNKRLNHKYYDKSKYPELKLKDSSEDILTSFKTKSNLFNTNNNECNDENENSFSSINNNLTINSKEQLNDDSNISELNIIDNNNKYINIEQNKCGGNFKFKNEEKNENNENLGKILNDFSILEFFGNNNKEKETDKIDYRYHCIFNNEKNLNQIINNRNNYKKDYFWLAVYDKLIKRKKMLKVLKFYGNTLDETKIIEKCIKIENFELFYNNNYKKPLIRPGKNFILVKLYLLNIDQINIISNYLNRINMKINVKLNEINNNRNSEIDIGKYKSLFSECKYYPYPLLYYLGNYMNINIISFSNYSYTNLNNIDNNKLINSCQFQNMNEPSSKKMAKFIKLLMINFPQKKYNFEFLLFYVMANLKYTDFNQKYSEITEIMNSFNLCPNNNIKNKRKIKEPKINIEMNNREDNLNSKSKNDNSNNNISKNKNKTNSIKTDSSFLSNNTSDINSKSKKSKKKSHQNINKTKILSNLNEVNSTNSSTNKNKNHKNKIIKNKKTKELTYTDEIDKDIINNMNITYSSSRNQK